MGGTMAELKIIQSNMMALMACDALRDFYPGERPYVTNRAGYAGIQRYAQVWGVPSPTTCWSSDSTTVSSPPSGQFPSPPSSHRSSRWGS